MKKISLKKIENQERFKVDFVWKEEQNNDVVFGNPLSNVALGIVYSWLYDDEKANNFFEKIVKEVGGFCSVLGMIRTVYGLNLAIPTILKNPNINKFIILIPNKSDNVHFVASTLTEIYLKKPISLSKTKQLNLNKKVLERFRKQVDLIIIKNFNIEKNINDLKIFLDFCVSDNVRTLDDVKKLIKLDLMFYTYKKDALIYDDGARFLSGISVKPINYSSEIFIQKKINILSEIKKRMVTIDKKNIVWNLIIHLTNENPKLAKQNKFYDLEYSELDQHFYVIKKCKLSEVNGILTEAKKCKEKFITIIFISIEE
ncbi:MAG: hypothetical protein QXS41_03860 [Candidatus Woesearchaeota archaeon]